MSFLSRRPSRSGNRASEAGRDAENDDYDYAPDGYARGGDDDSWSANEYFSPEGIKGRRAVAHPSGDQPTGRYDAAGHDGGDSFPGDGYGADEHATGAFSLPDSTDDERGDRGGRRRKDRGERGGRLRLRRDKGDDIWPDDGVSDEDYWASVAADRPLPAAEAPLPAPPPAPVQAASEPRGGSGRLGPAPGLVSDYQATSAAGALRRSAPQRSVTNSGGLPRADASPPPPSFGPSGRPQDRPDWGEQTERIDRVTATGYPDPRASSRGWPEPGPRTADRREPSPEAGRDPGRNSGAWPASGRDTARGPGRGAGPEDPLTSTTYSRSAQADTDGRSYRAAARRSQAQDRLDEPTQTFAAPVSYGGPADRYPADRYPAGPRPGGRAQTGEHPAARYGQQRADAQEPAARYPAYGSQQPGQAPPPAPPAQPNQPSQPSQRGGHTGRVSLPGGSAGLTGQYPQSQPAQQAQPTRPPRQPQPQSQPPLPAGGNPYDSAVTGSYPYPGQAGYPGRSPQPPQAPDPAAREDRRRRPAPPDGYGRY